MVVWAIIIPRSYEILAASQFLPDTQGNLWHMLQTQDYNPGHGI